MLHVMHMEATILLAARSYHWPIFLSIDTLSKPCKRPFNFNKFWLSHPYFLNNVKFGWEEAHVVNGSLMYFFQQRLSILK